MLFSAMQMLKSVKSLVFLKGSQSQILYDVDFASTAMVSLSNRICKWSVMTRGGRRGGRMLSSVFSHSYKALYLGANYVLSSFANKLLATWNSLPHLNNVRSVGSVPSRSQHLR